MFRKTAFGAAAVLATGLLAVGCSDDGDTVVQDTVPSTFPATPAAASFVGDDGRALSHEGEDANLGEWFPNIRDNTGIYVYEDADDNLMATYYNGSVFTSPVELRGPNHNPGLSAFDLEVLWLHPTAAGATGRQGDALIAYRRQELPPADLDPGAASDAAKDNIRLYVHYFDRSEVNNSGGTWRNGFDTLGLQADDDIRDTTDDEDEDVTSAMFVSDSRAWSYGPGSSTASGQDTSRVFLAYTQSEGGTDDEVNIFTKEFVLDTTTNATNAFSAATQIADGGDNGAASTLQAAHNFTVFFTTVDDDGNALLQYAQLDQSATSAATVSQVDAAANGTEQTNLPSGISPRNIYGGDHGLARVNAFYIEGGFGDDADTGDESQDDDVMYVVINTATGAAASNVSRAEIDSATGNAEAADQFADASGLQTALTRDRDFIGVFFTQFNDEDPAAASRVVIPFGTAVNVDPAGTATTDITAIGNRIPAAPLALSNLTDDTDNGAASFELQVGLADGMEPADCNVQSDANNMWILFQQTDDELTRLLVNGIVVNTAGANPALSAAGQRNVANIDDGWFSDAAIENTVGFDWDSGADWGIDTAEAFDVGGGDVGVVMPHQFNEDTTDVNDAASDDDYMEPRIIFIQGTTQTLIGSHAPAGTLNGRMAEIAEVEIVTLGVDAYNGNNPNDGGDKVVFVFREREATTGDRWRTVARVWDKANANSANPAALPEQFTPSLGSATAASRTVDDLPAVIDHEFGADSEIQAVVNSGNGADVYMTQGGHLYWNRFSGSSWLAKPQLVDNRYRTTLEADPQIEWQGGGNLCDTDVILFYLKDVDPNDATDRIISRDPR